MNTRAMRPGTACTMAQAVRNGDISARKLVEDALSQIALDNPALRCVTDLTAQRALDEAAAVDAAHQHGETPGPLAGVPFAVKNLFDLEGVTTRAGSKINRDNPPASRDAFAVRALSRAGAVCIGALNMGEYAYDFTGENAHDGHCTNPFATAHMAGGSSSGPAAAVAAGIVPFTLGSDTNGSIRVPSSYCGLFGLKPTFGRLSRAGTFPFCASLDHIGPIALDPTDLALVYDALQGADPNDPVQARRPVQPVSNRIEKGAGTLRIALADGYFQDRASFQAATAVQNVANALGVTQTVTIAQAEHARAAAFVITAAESSGLHLKRLQTRANDFDPMMRDRLLAGAMIPTPWVTQAHRFRRWYQRQLATVFESLDIIITPATPTTAPAIGQQVIELDGQAVPTRQAIGIYTQPISFAGLPAVTVPVWQTSDRLPIGVQIVGAPWQEENVLRIAWQLEQLGICRARVANSLSAAKE